MTHVVYYSYNIGTLMFIEKKQIVNISPFLDEIYNYTNITDFKD